MEIRTLYCDSQAKGKYFERLCVMFLSHMECVLWWAHQTAFPPLKESFNNVTHWLKDIDRYTSTEVFRVLVGNKVDLNKSTGVVIKTATGKVSMFGVAQSSTILCPIICQWSLSNHHHHQSTLLPPPPPLYLTKAPPAINYSFLLPSLHLLDKELAAEYQISFVETSALDGTNIQSLFDDIARGIMAGGVVRDSTPKVQPIVVGPNGMKRGANPGSCSC